MPERQHNTARTPWAVFDVFRRPAEQAMLVATWSTAIDGWLKQVREAAASEAAAIREMLSHWQLSLGDDDPSQTEWGRFRPLRLSREEDWTDWLAHLLESRDGHEIAKRLFPPRGPSIKVERAEREDRLLGGARRADLILLWDDDRAAHVEVKIGDEHFAKTVETADGCRKKYKRCDWADYVLIPEESKDTWLDEGLADIDCVTWNDVALEFRRALLSPNTSQRWRSFATVYCGAIEQKILGVPVLMGASSVRFTPSLFRFGRMIREAVENG